MAKDKKKQNAGIKTTRASAVSGTPTASILHIPQKNDEPVFSFGAVIQKYRNENGMSQTELARIMGTSRNTVTNWETDKSRPEIDTIRELCTLLGIPLYELFNIPSVGTPTASENRMLNQYRKLSPVSRKVVNNLVRNMLEEETNARDDLLRKNYGIISLEATPTAAGIGCPDTGLPPDYFFVKKNRRSSSADTIVRVSGRSMEPKYHDGDLVYVKFTSGADDEDDVVCVYHEGFIIKRFRNRKLYSLNTAYDFGDDHEFDDIVLLGRVLGIVEEDDIPSPDDIPILEELFASEIREFQERYRSDC